MQDPIAAPRGFGSDNHSGVHPAVLTAIVRANVGHAPAYGQDAWCAAAQKIFAQHFGDPVHVFYVFSGTGANVTALRALTPAWGSVVCAQTAHINVDECAAPEAHAGMKLTAVPDDHGKVTVEALLSTIKRRGDQHYASPRVLSLTQPTELGTLYGRDELKALCDAAHAHDLKVHLDGARLVNAAAALGCSLKAITRDAGVDAVSFGGTKNGLLAGEAVLFFDPALAREFNYIRKQGMQLVSKARFVAAQFSALLSGDVWLNNANHANAMAKRLEGAIANLPGVSIAHPVQSNVVFARIPKAWVKPLRETSFFYVWDEHDCTVRLMTTWDTQPEDIDALAQAIAVQARS